MLLLRKKIIKGWENLSSEKKDKYINDALRRKENCKICEQDEIDSSSDEVNWVSCNDCERWYHAKCVHIDSFYAESVPIYTWPRCKQTYFDGLPKLIAYFHFKPVHELFELDGVFSLWVTHFGTQKVYSKTYFSYGNKTYTPNR